MDEKINGRTEADYVFEKTYVCPVCGTTFKALRARTGRMRLLGTDPDMRPIYQSIDVIKYDCVACENCGYAAMAKGFDEISDTQIKIIRKEIASKFKGLKHASRVYTYDEALIRTKLALANSMVKHGKLSDSAYICLKIAWLYRGKRNELIAPGEERTRQLSNLEKEYMNKALAGFKEASTKEMFPIAGMDEWTFDFLLAELSRECNQIEDAKKLVSHLILSKNVPERIKDKARELRDSIMEKEAEA